MLIWVFGLCICYSVWFALLLLCVLWVCCLFNFGLLVLFMVWWFLLGFSGMVFMGLLSVVVRLLVCRLIGCFVLSFGGFVALLLLGCWYLLNVFADCFTLGVYMIWLFDVCCFVCCFLGCGMYVYCVLVCGCFCFDRICWVWVGRLVACFLFVYWILLLVGLAC